MRTGLFLIKLSFIVGEYKKSLSNTFLITCVMPLFQILMGLLIINGEIFHLKNELNAMIIVFNVTLSSMSIISVDYSNYRFHGVLSENRKIWKEILFYFCPKLLLNLILFEISTIMIVSILRYGFQDKLNCSLVKLTLVLIIALIFSGIFAYWTTRITWLFRDPLLAPNLLPYVLPLFSGIYIHGVNHSWLLRNLDQYFLFNKLSLLLSSTTLHLKRFIAELLLSSASIVTIWLFISVILNYVLKQKKIYE